MPRLVLLVDQSSRSGVSGNRLIRDVAIISTEQISSLGKQIERIAKRRARDHQHETANVSMYRGGFLVHSFYRLSYIQRARVFPPESASPEHP